jgi:flagellar basal-body rod protein FlgC
MSEFSALAVSASGLTAQRLRMEVAAQNLANASTTRSTGGPYKRRQVVFAALMGEALPVETPVARFLRAAEGTGGGVAVVGIVEDPSPPRLVYEPGHPDADARGFVAYPNVNPLLEMVDLIAARRAYEANVVAIEATKTMVLRSLDIVRG